MSRTLRISMIYRKNDDLEELIIMASGIGALTNPNKLANTFRSEKKSSISYDFPMRITSNYLCDSFLVERATRYDIKGKRYINSPFKYYFMDLGLRNARINFRQYEKSHFDGKPYVMKCVFTWI